MVTKRILSVFGIFLFIPMFCAGVLVHEWFNEGIAFAGEPPTEPLMSVEAGSGGGSLAIDAQNRWLVGDFRKSLRVWDVSTGHLVSTLRPPIGYGLEGMQGAVSISPDGNTIAAGGATGAQWDKTYSVYLFHRESGKLLKRITGLPERISMLAFSPNGLWLAVNLGRQICIYRTADYTLVASDTNYDYAIMGMDFSRQGRFVSVSQEGTIRLYDLGDGGLRLVAKKLMEVDPRKIRFSPDDSKIAVGFFEGPAYVISADSLELLYTPEVGGMGKGTGVSAVAWSSDGQYLYGGNLLYKVGRPLIIRQWADAGRGGLRELEVLPIDISVGEILSLVNGGMVFKTSTGWGMFDSTGRSIRFVGTQKESLKELLVSKDERKIQLSTGQSIIGFDIDEPAITSVVSREGLNPPVVVSHGLNVEEWDYSNPKVNGVDIKSQGKVLTSLSLAIEPNGNTFVLGTYEGLYHFGRNGEEIWFRGTEQAGRRVNISGDGKIIVAALDDGTIHWYRLSDGKELLALLPHTDRKRWILWTPSGYYDASPGAEDLIGWHVNNGKDNAADFFPASRFRNTYYRPDIIAKVLTTLDEEESVRLANQEAGRKSVETSVKQMFPPVVTILSPAYGTEVTSSDIIVKYSIRTPSGEVVTGIKALVDGRPVQQERGVQIKGKDGVKVKGEEIREIKITIPERDCEISILAENKYSVSEPATVRIKWKGTVQKDEFVIKPKLYLLSIGVSKYENKELTLGLAAKDAKDFADAMLKQKDGIYRNVAAKVLTDGNATKDEILDGLDWIQKETTSKDVAMVFLAGHGVNDPSGIYYYLPANADIEKLKRTGVAFTDIKNTVASLSGKTLFFVDTCHSGNVMGKRRGVTDITAVVNELSGAENGAVVFASSSGNQYSLEDTAWGNGAFTKALVEGISGKADYTGKGKISINMLDLYLSERVKELTKGKQTPTTTKPQTIADFPIAVRR